MRGNEQILLSGKSTNSQQTHERNAYHQGGPEDGI